MKYLICAIIKNEHRYLAEWIEHHLSIGFDDIYLFEDFGSDSHKEITDKYPHVHLDTCDNYFTIKRDYDKGNHRQNRLYQKFLYQHRKESGWCAFIDIDEYIMTDGSSLDDITKDYTNSAGIAMFWKMYNASGHVLRPSNIVKSYTERCSQLKQDWGWNFKSLVNLNVGEEVLSVHQVNNLVDIYNNPVRVTRSNPITYEKIWINHYYTKSYEDWRFRMDSRGDLFKNHRKEEGFFELNPDMIPVKDLLYANKLEEAQNILNKRNHINYDWSELQNKKVLIVGDKHIKDNIDASKYDVVIMFNRMPNYYKVGRCDMWFVDPHHEFYKLTSAQELKPKVLNTKWACVPYTYGVSSFDRYALGLTNGNIKITSIDVDNLEKTNEYETQNTFTTSFLYIIFLVNLGIKDLTLIGFDVYNRHLLLSRIGAFYNTWHINALKVEERILKECIDKGKLKYIEPKKKNVKIYCLTVENSERHRIMKEHLDSIGIPYQFIFGKKFENSAVTNPDDSCWKLSEFSEQPNYLSRAYSCANGHREICETFLSENDVDWALACEDDCLFSVDKIKDEINIILENFTEDWYHLSTEAYWLYTGKIKEIEPYIQLKKLNDGRSSMCYLMNKTFAKKYMNDLTPIIAPNDVTMWRTNKYIPAIYGVHIQFSDQQKHSLIGGKHI